MSANIDPILRHFDYQDLPPDSAKIGEQFSKIAQNIVLTWPLTEERTRTLELLRKTRDMAVTAFGLARP